MMNQTPQNLPAPDLSEDPFEALIHCVGRTHVLRGRVRTQRFATGYRTGGGPVEAVVTPGSLKELWECLQILACTGRIIIMQAANTGLTGGSTPDGTYDRPVVLINTLRLTGILPIRDGHQVICSAGATLTQLERRLEPYGREPHSVIGSSCIGASVIGGICNNSGGALVRRGPAYTEMALFAQINGDGTLELVNHLGTDPSLSVETVLEKLDAGTLSSADFPEAADQACSTQDYAQKVRNLEAASPARHNAEPSQLFEASGSAGRVVVFAVRLDTFEKAQDARLLYVAVKRPDTLSKVRQRCLAELEDLPISAEYLDPVAFDTAKIYGKDTFCALHWLGFEAAPKLFALKGTFDAWMSSLAGRFGSVSDHMLQAVSRILPSPLPKHILALHDVYPHHLMIEVEMHQEAALCALLDTIFETYEGTYHACSPHERKAAFLHRFVTAGAAVRKARVSQHHRGALVAIDVALPRNAKDWRFQLPDHLEAQIAERLVYGHFLCFVFHLDYIVKPGVDTQAFEDALVAFLRAKGAQCPAEHNVGHLYKAPENLVGFYRSLDPTNTLNPGIGKTSKCAHWT